MTALCGGAGQAEQPRLAMWQGAINYSRVGQPVPPLPSVGRCAAVTTLHRNQRLCKQGPLIPPVPRVSRGAVCCEITRVTSNDIPDRDIATATRAARRPWTTPQLILGGTDDTHAIIPDHSYPVDVVAGGYNYGPIS